MLVSKDGAVCIAQPRQRVPDRLGLDRERSPLHIPTGDLPGQVPIPLAGRVELPDMDRLVGGQTRQPIQLGLDRRGDKPGQFLDPHADVAKLFLAIGLDRQQRPHLILCAGGEGSAVDLQLNRAIQRRSSDDMGYAIEDIGDLDAGAMRLQGRIDQSTPAPLVVRGLILVAGRRLIAQRPADVLKHRGLAGAAPSDQGAVLPVQRQSIGPRKAELVTETVATYVSGTRGASSEMRDSWARQA